MKYKKGDRVVIEIKDTGINMFENGLYYVTRREAPDAYPIQENLILGKLEDFQPAEQKIKMTVEEKKEFDELKRIREALFLAFSDIYDGEYPKLFDRLFDDDDVEENNKAQLEFARAWEKPSRIEVEKEKKYRIKILNDYLHFDIENQLYWLSEEIECGDGVQDDFTQAEIDKLQKQEQFKAIDLNKCKEEVEDD